MTSFPNGNTQNKLAEHIKWPQIAREDNLSFAVFIKHYFSFLKAAWGAEAKKGYPDPNIRI